MKSDAEKEAQRAASLAASLKDREEKARLLSPVAQCLFPAARSGLACSLSPLSSSSFPESLNGRFQMGSSPRFPFPRAQFRSCTSVFFLDLPCLAPPGANFRWSVAQCTMFPPPAPCKVKRGEATLAARAAEAAAEDEARSFDRKEWEAARADHENLRKHHAALQQEFSRMMELADHRKQELKGQEDKLDLRAAELKRREEEIQRAEQRIARETEQVWEGGASAARWCLTNPNG